MLRLALILPALLVGAPMAGAQVSGAWAEPGDPVAQHLLDLERTWALLDCNAGPDREAVAAAFYRDFIADDFVGTSPEGPTYTNADLIPATPPKALPEPERDCQFYGAKVRFFGPSLAVLYGRESAVIKRVDGTWAKRTLIWTDTLMQRGGKWQAIAVQDMVDPQG